MLDPSGLAYAEGKSGRDKRVSEMKVGGVRNEA